MEYDWGPLKDWVELGQSLGEISDITIEVIDGVQRLSFYTNHGIKFFYLKPGGSFLKDLEQAVCEIRREAEEDGLV